MGFVEARLLCRLQDEDVALHRPFVFVAKRGRLGATLVQPGGVGLRPQVLERAQSGRSGRADSRIRRDFHREGEEAVGERRRGTNTSVRLPREVEHVRGMRSQQRSSLLGHEQVLGTSRS